MGGGRVAAVPATEAPAFAAAYPSLFDAGYRVAYRLLGDREESFDIAQESCARAYVRWDELAPPAANPTAWVVRASTNLAIDRWRRLRTAQRHLSPAEATTALLSDRIDLHRALDALPERQRDVVLLRYISDLSQDDVAVVLGCTVGTVKSHAHRGLAALRATLDLGEAS